MPIFKGPRTNIKFFDESGNDYKTLRSAKIKVQKEANRQGVQIDIYKEWKEPRLDSSGNLIHWQTEKELAVRIFPKQSNPSKSSLLKKLRRGIRGTVKIQRGRLIIKT